MSNLKQELSAWAQRVETALPHECPACDEDLKRVHYFIEGSRETIHLTGRVNEESRFVATCPQCGERLHVDLHERRNAQWR